MTFCLFYNLKAGFISFQFSTKSTYSWRAMAIIDIQFWIYIFGNILQLDLEWPFLEKIKNTANTINWIIFRNKNFKLFEIDHFFRTSWSKQNFLRVLSSEGLKLVFSKRWASESEEHQNLRSIKIWGGISEVRLKKTRLFHLGNAEKQPYPQLLRNGLVRAK